MSGNRNAANSAVEKIERPPLPSLATVAVGGIVLVAVGLILWALVKKIIAVLFGLAVTVAILAVLGWVIVRVAKRGLGR